MSILSCPDKVELSLFTVEDSSLRERKWTHSRSAQAVLCRTVVANHPSVLSLTHPGLAQEQDRESLAGVMKTLRARFKKTEVSLQAWGRA